MYTIDDIGNIIRNVDKASIPQDLKNKDYAEFLKWEAKGNVAPIVADVKVPPYVDRMAALEARVTALEGKGGK